MDIAERLGRQVLLVIVVVAVSSWTTTTGSFFNVTKKDVDGMLHFGVVGTFSFSLDLTVISPSR